MSGYVLRDDGQWSDKETGEILEELPTWEDAAAIDVNEQAHADAVLQDEIDTLDNLHQAWLDAMLDAGVIFEDIQDPIYNPEYGTGEAIITATVIEDDGLSGLILFTYTPEDDDELR